MRGGGENVNAENNAFRRKLERGAELRAVRSWGGNAEEDAELEAADAEDREKRRRWTMPRGSNI